MASIDEHGTRTLRIVLVGSSNPDTSNKIGSSAETGYIMPEVLERPNLKIALATTVEKVISTLR